MRKVISILLAVLFLFTLQQNVNAEGQIDHEANIKDFVENPEKLYRIDELIQNSDFKYVLGRFLDKESDDEITWNELNEAINKKNGDFDSYMDLYLNGEGDTDAFKIFENTKVTSLPWIKLDYDEKLDFLDPTIFPELKELHITGHSLKHADLAGFDKLESLVLSGDEIATLNISDSVNLKELLLTAGKVDTMDLANFSKLEMLDLAGMNLKALDLTNLHHLKELWLQGNTFGSIDLKGLQELDYLRIVSNDVKSLELINLPKLTEVWLEENTLESLIVKNAPNVKRIYHHNHDVKKLTSLQLRDLTSLDYIDFRGTKLNSIDLSNVPSLKTLEIDGSELETIDLSQLSQLEGLMIDNSKIKAIDLSGLSKLTSLSLSHNQLHSIDLSEQRNLKELFLSDNYLSSIDLKGLNKLQRISLANNNLNSIDLSEQSEVHLLHLEKNNLRSLTPFEHLLDYGNFQFFNIHENKINLHSLKNKPIHDKLLKKLDKDFDVYGAAYKYHNQSPPDYHLKIGGEVVPLNGGDVMNIPETNSSIVFPEDLPQGTDLEIKELDKNDQSKLIEGTPYDLAGDIFQFTFDNSLQFDGKFTLILDYDNKKFKESEIAVYYYNAETKEWEKIGGQVDAQNGTVTVEVDHFSIYGVLANVTDDHPNTGTNTSHSNESNSTEPLEKESTSGKENEVESQTNEIVKHKGEIKTDSSQQKDGKKLPNTATNAFNFVVIGILLVFIGVVTYVVIRRKKSFAK